MKFAMRPLDEITILFLRAAAANPCGVQVFVDGYKTGIDGAIEVIEAGRLYDIDANQNMGSPIVIEIVTKEVKE